MVGRAFGAAMVLGLGLACGGDFVQGVRTGAEQGFDKRFRTSFVSACVQQSTGVDADLQRRVCSCVADELVDTKTPGELADLLTSPSMAEVQPMLEACARKFAR